MAPRTRAEWVLPASMLIGTFAWSFIYVSLPFHIQKMSTLDPASALRWTGWILGISPLITVITAPISGRLGFQLSFILGAFMLWGCSALVSWGVPTGKPRDAAAAGTRTTSLRELVTVSLVVLAGSTQIFFLTSILPQILPPLGVAPESTLEVGGFLIFATGIAASLGPMAALGLAVVPLVARMDRRSRLRLPGGGETS